MRVFVTIIIAISCAVACSKGKDPEAEFATVADASREKPALAKETKQGGELLLVEAFPPEEVVDGTTLTISKITLTQTDIKQQTVLQIQVDAADPGADYFEYGLCPTASGTGDTTNSNTCDSLYVDGQGVFVGLQKLVVDIPTGNYSVFVRACVQLNHSANGADTCGNEWTSADIVYEEAKQNDSTKADILLRNLMEQNLYSVCSASYVFAAGYSPNERSDPNFVQLVDNFLNLGVYGCMEIAETGLLDSIEASLHGTASDTTVDSALPVEAGLVDTAMNSSLVTSDGTLVASEVLTLPLNTLNPFGVFALAGGENILQVIAEYNKEVAHEAANLVDGGVRQGLYLGNEVEMGDFGDEPSTKAPVSQAPRLQVLPPAAQAPAVQSVPEGDPAAVASRRSSLVVLAPAVQPVKPSTTARDPARPTVAKLPSTPRGVQPVGKTPYQRTIKPSSPAERRGRMKTLVKRFSSFNEHRANKFFNHAQTAYKERVRIANKLGPQISDVGARERIRKILLTGNPAILQASSDFKALGEAQGNSLKLYMERFEQVDPLRDFPKTRSLLGTTSSAKELLQKMRVEAGGRLPVASQQALQSRVQTRASVPPNVEHDSFFGSLFSSSPSPTQAKPATEANAATRTQASEQTTRTSNPREPASGEGSIAGKVIVGTIGASILFSIAAGLEDSVELQLLQSMSPIYAAMFNLGGSVALVDKELGP